MKALQYGSHIAIWKRKTDVEHRHRNLHPKTFASLVADFYHPAFVQQPLANMRLTIRDDPSKASQFVADYIISQSYTSYFKHIQHLTLNSMKNASRISLRPESGHLYLACPLEAVHY
jgi:hypothetical protein